MSSHMYQFPSTRSDIFTTAASHVPGRRTCFTFLSCHLQLTFSTPPTSAPRLTHAPHKVVVVAVLQSAGHIGPTCPITHTLYPSQLLHTTYSRFFPPTFHVCISNFSTLLLHTSSPHLPRLHLALRTRHTQPRAVQCHRRIAHAAEDGLCIQRVPDNRQQQQQQPWSKWCPEA